jgi:hypothetical protein
MPSELERPAASPRGFLLEWLSSQGLGVLCGQATVLLLALGSILLAATRDGASAGIGMDDFRGFLVEPSLVHVWFYLLVPVLGLYALNALLASWNSVTSRWRSGLRSPAAYAAPVIHVAFLVALFAHLVGGLGSTEQGRVVVGPSWGDLGDGRQARLVELDVEPLPDGGIKQVRATVEIRDPGGGLSTAIIGYNGPLSSGLGSDLFLLLGPGEVSAAARLVRGRDRCEVDLESRCNLAGAQVRLLYLHPSRRPGMSPLARLRVRTAPDAPAEDFWLSRGHPRQLADGSTLILEEVTSRPAIHLRRRHAPGNPWALLATILFVLGMGMMWRRFL